MQIFWSKLQEKCIFSVNKHLYFCSKICMFGAICHGKCIFSEEKSVYFCNKMFMLGPIGEEKCIFQWLKVYMSAV